MLLILNDSLLNSLILMINKHFPSVFVTLLLTLSGLSFQIKEASIKPMSAVAQSASCDTKIRAENFSLRVGSSTGINLRSNRQLDARTNKTVAYNATINFDGWGYGQSVNDLWNGKPDAIWLRLKERTDGQERWVPSAYMIGYPPSKPPTQPNCTSSFTMSDYYQRLYGHTQASSSRGFATHKAIDSNSNKSPYEVRALIGGEVKTVKNGQVVQNPVNLTTYTCQNNSAASNGTIEIWNPDLQQTYLYLHFQTNSIRVKPGDKVNPGDVIGIEGTTGCSTNRHTHVGVNSGKEDPLVALGTARSIGVIDKKYK